MDDTILLLTIFVHFPDFGVGAFAKCALSTFLLQFFSYDEFCNRYGLLGTDAVTTEVGEILAVVVDVARF